MDGNSGPATVRTMMMIDDFFMVTELPDTEL